MTTYAELVYNPNIDTEKATAIECNCYVGVIIGHIHDKGDGVVEWRYNVDGDNVDESQFSTFVGDFGEWLDKHQYRTACWDNSTNYENVLARVEHSYLKWWFGEHKDLPLVKFDDFKVMVDAYLAVVPADYRMHTGDIDLSDVINEVGMDSIDRYSIGNMLTHFHGENWTWKAERMTIIAYKWQMDIHPMAIALTPTTAALMRGAN
ncbi:hypothetical protein pEaSNUABM54_00242 [Erwinia phage pEa_SNUABM_54]|nr:hypothetical protein pEaSNUABM54_00242 [Erwinia phage pEa_SNUABM_54]